MEDFQIYKLHFTTPVHFGDNSEDYGISLPTLQSDAIYAALMACLAKIGQPIPDNGDLGFTNSSLFPYYEGENGRAVYFLPKPLRQKLPKVSDLSKAKSIKKVTWIDIDYFKRVVKGENLFDNEKDITNIQGIYLTSATIDKDFISSQISPRVTINSRIGKEDAQPYYMDRVSFKDNSGLYFIAKGDCSLLEKALHILQYEGIGTDRNVGNGFFEWSKDSLRMENPKSEYVMSLSLFIPSNKEELSSITNDENVAYDFIRRGGWITTYPHNTLRKDFIYAFTPGSVFKYEADQTIVLGDIKELTPTLPKEMEINHKIWRTGRALFLPIKLR